MPLCLETGSNRRGTTGRGRGSTQGSLEKFQPMKIQRTRLVNLAYVPRKLLQVLLEAGSWHMKEKKIIENRQCGFAKGNMLDQPDSCYNEMTRSIDE